MWKEIKTPFEDMPKEQLAEVLREFYPSARQTVKGQDEGKPYAKQSLINIRSAINRHLQLPPHNKPWNIMNDKEFLAANRVFKGKNKTHFKIINRHCDEIVNNKELNNCLNYVLAGNLRDQKEKGLDKSC